MNRTTITRPLAGVFFMEGSAKKNGGRRKEEEAHVRLKTLTHTILTFCINHLSSFDQIGGSSSSAQLGLANLGGVFIVLLGGMFISIIVAIFEFAWKRRKLLVDENVREILS